MNQWYEEWLSHSNNIFPAVLGAHSKYYPESQSNAGHVTGLVFVGASYVAGAAMVAFGGPVVKGVGLAIVTPPNITDPVLYAAGYYVGEVFFDDWF